MNLKKYTFEVMSDKANYCGFMNKWIPTLN